MKQKPQSPQEIVFVMLRQIFIEHIQASYIYLKYLIFIRNHYDEIKIKLSGKRLYPSNSVKYIMV